MSHLSDRAPFDGLCPDCDGKLMRAWHEMTLTYGDEEEHQKFVVDLPIHTCSDCGFETLSDYGIRLKHEALCRHLGVLTPAEIRNIRELRGLNRLEFAELTGIGEASLGRWERAEGVQSLAYDRYLRLLSVQDGIHQLKSVVPKLKDGLGSQDETSDEPAQDRFPGLSGLGTQIDTRTGFKLVPATKTT